MLLLHHVGAWCRSYAAAICELLDPSGCLFGQRIISQGAADGMQQDLTKRLMQVCHPFLDLIVVPVSWFFCMQVCMQYCQQQQQQEQQHDGIKRLMQVCFPLIDFDLSVLYVCV